MSLRELFASCYLWLDVYAGTALLAAAIWPAGGLLLARIGKAGRTDRDARIIANIVIGSAVLLLRALYRRAIGAISTIGRN